jgi:hypothetical protein
LLGIQYLIQYLIKRRTTRKGRRAASITGALCCDGARACSELYFLECGILSRKYCPTLRCRVAAPRRTVLTPRRLPSYVERVSKRVLPSSRVESARARARAGAPTRTHARTHARTLRVRVVVPFIKSCVSRGNACARTLTTGTSAVSSVSSCSS